jgi:CubicO group peptidase (beta-lactamase class C family)
VMSHTAGLPLHYQFYYENQPYPVVSNDETIARYAVLVNPPGEVFEYSNLGYGVLDHIIARTSGMDYVDFMRANVFIPLGLTRMSVGIGPGLEPYVAQRYDRRQRRIPFYDFDHRGGSAVYASAHDLLRFGMFHLKDHLSDQRKILTDSTIDAMQQPVAPATYGLGWILAEREGLRTVSHTGGMPGVQTGLTLYPTEHVAVVVLMNTVAEVPRIGREIERVLLPRYADARRRSDTAQPPAATTARFTPPNELVGEWAGTLRTWERTLPMKLVVQTDGDVHVSIDGGLETVLNQVRWQGNQLEGRFAGTIPTSDASRWPHNVELSVRLRGGTLNGMAAAETTTDPVYFALSSYVALSRRASDK